MEEDKSMYQIGQDVQNLKDFTTLSAELHVREEQRYRWSLVTFALIGGCIGWIFGEIRSLKQKLKEPECETGEES